MHMNTRAHTYQNEHAWAVTCARTHWYLSTSQSQNFSFFFFLKFFFVFKFKWYVYLLHIVFLGWRS